MARVWTCQRVTEGVKCGAENPRRNRKCGVCNKTRPATKKPAHMAALDLPYEFYVEINGGEHCGICLKPRTARKHHRDHEHAGDGLARGILCWSCNALLPARVDAAWCRAAAAYLDRAEARR